MSRMERFGILLGRGDAPSREAARAAENAFDAYGESARIGSRYPAAEEDAFFQGLEAVLAIGGDGTILAAARRAALHGVAVMGVNLGRVGFLSEIEPHEIGEGITRLVRGAYTIDARMMLKARCGNETVYALNDIMLARRARGRVMRAGIRIDSVPAEIVTADGVLVASPTGSTAYALSCGGPIMPPNLDAMLVAAICPHSLTHRHMLVDGGGLIRLSALPEPDEDNDAALYADGRQILPVRARRYAAR